MDTCMSIWAGLIATVLAYIAWQQYSLAREKFKLDMFEKRFVVYKATQRFLTAVLKDAKVDMNKLIEFRRDTQDATFLFGQEIPAYLERLDGRALELWTTTNTRQPLPRGEERSRLCRKETELTNALISELPGLKDVFAPGLRFRKWHGRRDYAARALKRLRKKLPKLKNV